MERDMAWGSPEGCMVTTGAVPGPRPKATVPTAHVRKSQDPGLRGERPLGGLSFSVLELSKRIRDDDDDDGNGFLEKIEETIEEESRKGKKVSREFVRNQNLSQDDGAREDAAGSRRERTPLAPALGPACSQSGRNVGSAPPPKCPPTPPPLPTAFQGGSSRPL